MLWIGNLWCRQSKQLQPLFEASPYLGCLQSQPALLVFGLCYAEFHACYINGLEKACSNSSGLPGEFVTLAMILHWTGVFYPDFCWMEVGPGFGGGGGKGNIVWISKTCCYLCSSNLLEKSFLSRYMIWVLPKETHKFLCLFFSLHIEYKLVAYNREWIIFLFAHCCETKRMGPDL